MFGQFTATPPSSLKVSELTSNFVLGVATMPTLVCIGSSSLFHLTIKLTQTKTANENSGRKIGNSDKTIYVETCFS